MARNQSANRAARDYWHHIKANGLGRINDTFYEMWPDDELGELSVAAGMKRARRTIDSAHAAEFEIETFAREQMSAPSPEAFRAFRESAEGRVAPDAVLRALRTGVRDGLHYSLAGSCGLPNFGRLVEFQTSSAIREVVESLFGSAARPFFDGLANELARFVNCRMVFAEYVPEGRSILDWARRIVGVETWNAPEWVAVVTMALAPVDTELIARIRFPGNRKKIFFWF